MDVIVAQSTHMLVDGCLFQRGENLSADNVKTTALGKSWFFVRQYVCFD